MLWHAVVIICICFAVCESCIEPIPVCLPGEILAVDMNTTNHCCPQYHCGSYNKNTSSHCTEVPSHFVCRNETEKHDAFKGCVLIFSVCDTSLCPEPSVSCAPGAVLVKRPVPDSCCPETRCGIGHMHTYLDI